MLTCRVDLRGLDRAAELWKRFPNRLKAHLRQAMIDSEAEVLKGIKDNVSDKLLRVRTGNLRRNFSAGVPTANESGGYTGIVGSGRTEYAAVHEFGFDGQATVRAHSRAAARTRKASAWGSRGRDVFKRRSKNAPTFEVRAHQRHMRIPGRRYAGQAMDAAQPAIVRFHEQAVADTAKETGS